MVLLKKEPERRLVTYRLESASKAVVTTASALILALIISGDLIHSFNGANDAIGTLVVKFNNEQQQYDMMSCINSWVKIITE